MKLPEHGVLPVIHVLDEVQAVDMATMAAELGATGVFLIDHKSNTMMQPEFLALAARAVRLQKPDQWLGLNCLSVWPEDNLRLAGRIGLGGAWVDDAVMVNPDGVSDRDYQEINRLRWLYNISYFGGISMKGAGYIYPDDKAVELIKRRQALVDVVVTSGPETGVSINLERLKKIRDVLGLKRLAVASGVDLTNAAEQASLVDYLLVASSVERGSMSGIFDANKLGELIKIVQETHAER